MTVATLHPRAIAVQGIGYGPLLIALQGLLPFGGEDPTSEERVSESMLIFSIDGRPLEQARRRRRKEEALLMGKLFLT